MRLIDADALMQSLGITDMECDKCAWCDKEWNRCKRGGDFEDACCAIENAPTIEPEVKFIRLPNPNENPVDMFPLLTEEEKQQSREYAQGYSDALAERKKGEWEQVEVNYLDDMDADIKESMAIASMYCPICKRYHNEVYLYGVPTYGVNYCPNCGANLKGE